MLSLKLQRKAGRLPVRFELKKYHQKYIEIPLASAQISTFNQFQNFFGANELMNHTEPHQALGNSLAIQHANIDSFRFPVWSLRLNSPGKGSLRASNEAWVELRRERRRPENPSDGLHRMLHSLQVCSSQFLARPGKSRESACGLQILRLLLGHSLDKKQFVLEHGISMYFYVFLCTPPSPTPTGCPPGGSESGR